MHEAYVYLFLMVEAAAGAPPKANIPRVELPAADSYFELALALATPLAVDVHVEYVYLLRMRPTPKPQPNANMPLTELPAAAP